MAVTGAGWQNGRRQAVCRSGAKHPQALYTGITSWHNVLTRSQNVAELESFTKEPKSLQEQVDGFRHIVSQMTWSVAKHWSCWWVHYICGLVVVELALGQCAAADQRQLSHTMLHGLLVSGQAQHHSAVGRKTCSADGHARLSCRPSSMRTQAMLTRSLCHPAVADLCGWLLRGPEAEGPAQFRLHSSLPDQSGGVVVQQPNHTLATCDSSSVSTSSMRFLEM